MRLLSKKWSENAVKFHCWSYSIGAIVGNIQLYKYVIISVVQIWGKLYLTLTDEYATHSTEIVHHCTTADLSVLELVNNAQSWE